MPATLLECARCGRNYSASELHNRCECGGTLLARYDLSQVESLAWRDRPPNISRYRELLPLEEDVHFLARHVEHHADLEARPFQGQVRTRVRLLDGVLEQVHATIHANVRRPSVTIAMQSLEKAGAISTARGRLKIEKREPLLRLAGSTYGIAEAEQRRILISSK